MSLDISRETEARLMDEARKRGISVEALLLLLMKEREATTSGNGSNPELPVWHLGGGRALHRRDLYDDVG
jgi:hypothetical protein